MEELKDHTCSNFSIKNGYGEKLKTSLFHNE